MLDTGSSDLWISTYNGQELITTNTTNISVSIEYAIGDPIDGVVEFANFTVGDYYVPSQGKPLFCA